MERSMVDKGLAMSWANLRVSLLNKGYFYFTVCVEQEVSHLNSMAGSGVTEIHFYYQTFTVVSRI